MGSIMVRGLLYLVLQELLRCATCNTRLQYMYSYSTIKMYHGTIVLEPTSTQCSVQIYRYQTGTCTWHSNVNCQLIEGHVLYAYRTSYICTRYCRYHCASASRHGHERAFGEEDGQFTTVTNDAFPVQYSCKVLDNCNFGMLGYQHRHAPSADLLNQ